MREATPAKANPTISIALATFNGEAFIRLQLESIEAQTLKPDELIISDDGSTDRTLEIAADFASTASFDLRIIKNRVRLGFRANFLQAASACRGDLIAFCDQDDIWHPEKLEIGASMFTDDEVLLAHHDAVVTDENGHALGLLHQMRRPDPMKEANSDDPWRISHGFTQIFRRNLCAFNSLWHLSIDPDRPDSRMAHDQWMFFLASSLGRTAYIDRPLARYRQHATNAAGWTPTISRVRRIFMQFESRVDVYARCRDASRQRILILDGILRSSASSVTGRNASVAKTRYGHLELLYGLRHRLYQSPSLIHRFGIFCLLVKRSAYGSRGPFTFTYKGALKDLALGLAFGNITRKLGLSPSGGDPTCRSVDC